MYIYVNNFMLDMKMNLETRKIDPDRREGGLPWHPERFVFRRLNVFLMDRSECKGFGLRVSCYFTPPVDVVA